MYASIRPAHHRLAALLYSRYPSHRRYTRKVYFKYKLSLSTQGTQVEGRRVTGEHFYVTQGVQDTESAHAKHDASIKSGINALGTQV